MKKEFKLEAGTLTMTIPEHPEMVIREIDLRELDMTTRRDEPSEFWIRLGQELDHITRFEEDAGPNHIHVIEYSAFAKLQEENEKLKLEISELKSNKKLFCPDCGYDSVHETVHNLDAKYIKLEEKLLTAIKALKEIREKNAKRYWFNADLTARQALENIEK